ncbi:leucyl aminopeptidase family protein [Niveispirillum fermenti]|uniref:leucyl aminopeptidase family protein n=1 Tax=Niveispirillum fermenti TaxID=1233113 RepID=UPI003A8AC868
MKISFEAGDARRTLVLALFADKDVQGVTPDIAEPLAPLLASRDKDQPVDLLLPTEGGMRRIIVLRADSATPLAAEALGARIAGLPVAAGADVLDLLVPACPVLAGHVALGARLSAYRYTRFRTSPPKGPARPAGLNLPHGDAAAFEGLAALAEGVEWARDLSNAPPNAMVPALFVQECRALADLGVTVEVLEEAELRRLGMGALLGVGQGSAAPPAIAILRWQGVADGGAPLVLAGKGVTFDSGGLLPKQAEEMWDMKYDRAGAAAVAGAIRALALRRSPVDVVGIVGLAENMPSGGAQRPGDIVTSHAGLTVEVLHTDAEGRLLLADVLSYAIDRFNPRAIIDIATLTGGLTSVLTDRFGGLYANDDELAARLTRLGDGVGERLWRLPLDPAFTRMLDSPVADLGNICKTRWGGTATAAAFLHRFVGGVPWAHLDIFGPAWNRGSAGVPGATGYGVRLLTALAEAG